VSGCLAIANGASGPLQVAELSALTRVDGEGGLDRLVSELVQDGPTSAVAGDLLATLGEPAARAVAARFDELSQRGRRRALKTLGAALSLPEAEARVVQAAHEQDESLQQAAVNALAHGGEPGRKALRTLALESSASGDAAVRALAAPDRQELGALLAALAAPGGVDRAVLRRALIALGRRSGAQFDKAVEAFANSKPSVEARAALALIAAAAERPEVGLGLAESALDVADFPSRFRLCLAAGQLAPSAELDAWLAQKATSSEEWMLRREAYEALRARSSEQAKELADKIAHDKYPRVRAAAAPTLAQAGQKANLRELAHKDPWPLVRVAAIQSLARVGESRQVLAQSLEDSSRNVRAAAIDGLVQQKAADAWPEVAKRLVKEDEWPVVKAAALRFAGALCVQSARDALTELARRGLRHDASDDDRSLSLEALRALYDLGGEAAADARLIAERESGSPELKRVMEKSGPSRCEAKTAAATR
jgi:HEAT repeat protein